MKNGRNKGQIIVFVCLIICAFLVLILTILQGVRIKEGRAKCSQSVFSACKSLKGDYQPELFRRYHLLALDRTYYGKGEGFLEQRAEEFLNYNLNPEKQFYHFQVQEVILAESQTLTDASMAGMKQEIHEYMKLQTPVMVLEEVLSKTEEEQKQDREQIADELENQAEQIVVVEAGQAVMKKASITEEGSAGKTTTVAGGDSAEKMAPVAEEGSVAEGAFEIEEHAEEMIDPRGAMKRLLGMDILTLVMPEEAEGISKDKISMENLPSMKRTDSYEGFWTFQGEEMELADMAEAFKQQSFWDDIGKLEVKENGLAEITEEALYAMDTFGDAITRKKEEHQPLEFEIEYLLAGQKSDYENMSQVAEELVWIRFVSNGCYAFTNETMQEEAKLAAAVLLAPVGLAELAEPVSYVILGCWTYGESLLDVKALLHEKTVPVTKDDTTWKLSLNGLLNLNRESREACEASQGLSYEEYLFLLLMVQASINQEQCYYRMLDLMQLNIQETIPEFRIENCIVTFELQVMIEENGRQWHFQEAAGYL